jgi:hypothetical protein
MLSRTQEKLGTAGFIIAIVALIASLGGAAYAATKLNSTQKSEVRKIAKQEAKKAGKPGAPGAPGAAGPVGPVGPAGPTGTAGQQGAEGEDGKGVTSVAATSGECPEGGVKLTSASGTTTICNGEEGPEGPDGSPWAAGGTLPEGETETGAFGGKGLGGPFGLLPVTFSIPLESADDVTSTIVNLETASSAPGCPGLTANGTPQADVGKFCAYIGSQQLNLGAIATTGPPVNGLAPSFQGKVGPSGATLVVQSSAGAEENWEAFGAWAVTAAEEL